MDKTQENSELETLKASVNKIIADTYKIQQENHYIPLAVGAVVATVFLTVANYFL